MENVDVVVLRTLRDWRSAGQRALLATVVRTWGSSPRPVGSIMALRADGAVVGSVSGGCIEDDLIARCSGPAGEWPVGPPSFVRYGISADEAHRFGLPCGGTLELLLEPEPDAESLDALVRALEGGQLMQRRVRLADGHAVVAAADGPQPLQCGEALVNTFGPEYRLLLIGAGAMAECLATMALFSGFAVTVCDPRAEYNGSWGVPAARLATDMPDDAVRAMRPDRRSAVVALTHDPKLDDLALLEALASEAFYIGAIGSRRNQDARRARLAEHFGCSAADLQRLRGPVGLYIGSKTPPEIAVSIMAEILAVKNGVQLPPDMAVAEAKNRHAPAAESTAPAFNPQDPT
jgi:xanthine dehydrogenase accessory factor